MARSLLGLAAALLGTSPALALDPGRLPSQLVRESFGVRDGVPDGQVLSLLQAKDGALWVGTTCCVLRYDGHAFETVADGVLESDIFGHVRDFAVSTEGTMFAATAGGLLEIGEDRIVLRGSKSGLKHPYLYSLLASPDSLLLATGGAGLVSFAEGRFSRLESSSEVRAPLHIDKIVRDSEGRVWLAAEETLWTFDQTSRALRPVPLPVGRGVRTLHVSRGGALLVGGSFGVFERAKDGRFRERVHDLRVEAILEDRDGLLWLGTDSGLYRMQGGRPVLIREIDSGVFSLLEDKSGAIWVGTGEGIERFQDGAFATWGEPEGLVPHEILNLAQAPSGSLWLLDASGALRSGRPSSLQERHPPGTITGQGMLGMAEASNGTLWVAGSSLHEFRKGSRLAETQLEGSFSVLLSEGSRLLVADTAPSGTSRVFSYARGALTPLNVGVPLEHVQRLFRDHSGRLWLSTGGTGLVRLDGTGAHAFSAQEGLPSDTVYGITEDREGRIWVATRHGLAFVEGEKVSSLAHLSCTPRRSPVHLVIDEFDGLWVSADDGIYRIARSELMSALRGGSSTCASRVFGRKDGLRSLVVSWRPGGLTRLTDGTLCFATEGGLSCTKPRENYGAHAAMTPRIAEVRVGGGAREANRGRVRIEDRKVPLQIAFSVVELAVPELLEFQTRLEGFDSWSPPSRSRSVTYTNLPPGQFTFEVRSRYQGQEWPKESARASIIVEPAWYETELARGLGIMGLVALLFSALGFSRYRARRHRRELEAGVEERTRALAAQIEENRRVEAGLRELARDLDQHVRARTADLEIANRALRKSEERYELAVLGAADGLWDWDIAAGVLYLSLRWKQILGYGDEFPSTVDGWLSRTHPDDRALLRAVLVSAGEKGGNIRCEYRMLNRDEQVVWVLCRGVVVSGPNGPVRAAGSQTDITERKANEAELMKRITHDPLTGLPNRPLFVDRLGQALRRDQGQLAIILINIDRLKNINETRGLSVGDSVLKAVAAKAVEVLRDTDTLARLGSDEFALLLAEVPDDAAALRIVDRLREGLLMPASAGHTSQAISLSFGVKITDTASEEAETFLADAYLALEDAKSRGGGRAVVFTNSLGAEHQDRLHLEGGLRRALREGHFVLHYQPLVDLGSGQVASLEALIRWQDPRRGLVGPGQFIARAEACGLIAPISDWVLGEACRQAKSWEQELGFSVKISINIAPALLHGHRLADSILGELARHGLKPSSLGIEIVESSILELNQEVNETLSRLHAAGVGISIDDFGTGYSSLAYLSRLPITALKLDRSLVERVPEDTTDSAICKSMIEMADRLGIESVVEGVETPAQVEFLQSIGCKVAQGYHFSKPLSASDCRAYLLSDRSAKP